MTTNGDSEPTTFGALLRAIRSSTGLTQAQLGDLAQLSASTIRNLEADRYLPSRDSLLALLRVPGLRELCNVTLIASLPHQLVVAIAACGHELGLRAAPYAIPDHANTFRLLNPKERAVLTALRGGQTFVGNRSEIWGPAFADTPLQQSFRISMASILSVFTKRLAVFSPSRTPAWVPSGLAVVVLTSHGLTSCPAP